MVSFNIVLGVLLVAWLLSDLVHGKTYLWQGYTRSEQPFGYWATLTVWAVVAASCFIYPF